MLGGGARTILHDYVAFPDMISDKGLYNGKRILSEAAVALMQSDQVGAAKISKDLYVEHVRGANHYGIYGLGEWKEELDLQEMPY